MKTLITLALAAWILAPTMTPASAADATPAPAAAAKAPARKTPGRLHHLVAFKFKPTAGAADVRKVEDAFAALPAKVPQIASYESGTNVSPEKLDKGFTHAFHLTFRSAKDRDDYLVHPDHQEFGRLISPYIADVFVIDFWGGAAAPATPGAKSAAKPAAKPAQKVQKPEAK